MEEEEEEEAGSCAGGGREHMGRKVVGEGEERREWEWGEGEVRGGKLEQSRVPQPTKNLRDQGSGATRSYSHLDSHSHSHSHSHR